MARSINLVTPSETGPQSVIDEIKVAVATALMAKQLPGAFSFSVPEYSGTVNAKPTASAKDGKVMYNLSGDFTLGGQRWQLRGNIVPPKGSKLAIGGQDLTDYQAARKTLEDERKARALALGRTVSEQADTEESMSAGEST